jgi:hypothetical protein
LLILFAFGKISNMYSKRDSRYAAKRRAANKKRRREILRYIGVFGFIGILIIGTFATIVGTSILAPTTANTTGAPSPTTNQALSQLVTQGDAAVKSGDYNGGISYYLAYSSQNPTDADVLFKIGQTWVDPKNPKPDYLAGVAYLQRALTANPNGQWVSQAQALITQYSPQANAEATTTAVAALTATVETTATVHTGTTPTVPNSSGAPAPSSGAPQSSVTSTAAATK